MTDSPVYDQQIAINAYWELIGVVRRATARAVCRAFLAALAIYGIPEEVLTDIQDGKQFTGRFGKPCPAEVLFERICLKNGIRQLRGVLAVGRTSRARSRRRRGGGLFRLPASRGHDESESSGRCP